MVSLDNTSRRLLPTESSAVAPFPSPNVASQSSILVATQVAALIPELEMHEWSDHYFDSLKNDDDIIAVFDHDAALFEIARRGKLRQAVNLTLVAFGFSVVMDLLMYTIVKQVFFVTVACTGAQLVPVIQTWRSTLPHTAVTAEGVRHVDDNGRM